MPLKQALLGICLLLSFIQLGHSQCAQPSNIDLLQSGSATLLNAKGGIVVKEHLYSTLLTFQAPPASLKVAVSLGSFFSLSSPLDFSLRGRAGLTEGTLIIALIAGQDNSWVSMKVHFLVSGRSDFYMGNIYADTYLTSMYNSQVRVAYSIPTELDSQSAYWANTHLSGAKSDAIPFTFAITSTTISSSGLLTISLILPANRTTEGVFISYIALKQNSPFKYVYSPFSYQGISAQPYYFVGIKQINDGGGITYSNSAFFSANSSIGCVGEGCSSSCITFQNCSGQLSSGVCIMCLANQTVVNGSCQSNQNLCGSNQVWSGTECQCLFGFYMVGAACYQSCGVNAYSKDNVCSCLPGFRIVGSACVGCPANSSYNGIVCNCNPGLYLIGGICKQCSLNSIYSPSQGLCNCIVGYFNSNGSCSRCHTSCTTCYGPAVTQCLTCSTAITLNNGSCSSSCPSGTFTNGSKCSPCSSNCSVCLTALVCAACKNSLIPILEIGNKQIISSCKSSSAAVSLVLSMKNNAVNGRLVYQGIALSQLPPVLLVKNCEVCSDLLQVQTISPYFTPAVSVDYVVNSQFWFFVTFDFGVAPFLPNFQFTVQINPLFANYFAPSDMTQKLSGTISPPTSGVLYPGIRPSESLVLLNFDSWRTVKRASGSTASPSAAKNFIDGATLYNLFK